MKIKRKKNAGREGRKEGRTWWGGHRGSQVGGSRIRLEKGGMVHVSE